MSASLIAALLAFSSPGSGAELEYAPGTLAYQALVKGDLGKAEQQLRASSSANQNDPAWLLNYGQLLARSGRVNEASAIFRRVASAPDSEVVLANGEVTGTREASRRALQNLRLGGLSSR
jgi:Tfp pilus assembly protein PilF